MPVVTCPKCPTKLKDPEGAKGNVKCPKCGTVFPAVAPQPSAAFEVVDDAPPSKPATGTGSKPTAPHPKPPVKAAAADEGDDFEVVDEKPKTKKKATSDDDDDEDEDEKPKSKKKKRASDDDDDDEKPRSKKKKKKRASNDDDDDDDWTPRTSNRGAFAKAKTGAMLLAIGFWLNVGSYGLLALYAFIIWMLANLSSKASGAPGGINLGAGSSTGDILVLLPGLIGLGNWIVGLVGLSFCIAGPKKARGMAITATVFAGVHLILTGITFSNGSGGLGVGLRGNAAWLFVATTLPFLDALFPLLFYASRAVGEGDYVIGLLAAVCEVARLVFALLTLKALAAAARDDYAEEKAQRVIMAAIIVGAAAFAVLVMTVLLLEAGFKSVGAYANIGLGTMFLVFLGYTFMMIGAAMAALQTKDACNRRS